MCAVQFHALSVSVSKANFIPVTQLVKQQCQSHGLNGILSQILNSSQQLFSVYTHMFKSLGLVSFFLMLLKEVSGCLPRLQ